MKEVLENIKEIWNRDNLINQEKIADINFSNFEEKNNVVLPIDLKDYFFY